MELLTCLGKRRCTMLAIGVQRAGGCFVTTTLVLVAVASCREWRMQKKTDVQRQPGRGGSHGRIA